MDYKKHLQDFYQIVSEVFEEYERAKHLYPAWPSDPIHACAVMTEEAQEALSAALEHHVVIAVPGHEGVGNMAGLKDADFHGSPDLIKFNMGYRSGRVKPGSARPAGGGWARQTASR